MLKRKLSKEEDSEDEDDDEEDSEDGDSEDDLPPVKVQKTQPQRHSAIPRIAMFNGRKILGDNVPVSLLFNFVPDILVTNML